MYIFNDLKVKIKKTDILSIKNLDSFISNDTNRYAHIMGVVNLAKEIENTISFNGNLITAALYHDIGYSKKVKVTGFHPIDSAFKAYEDGLSQSTINAIITHTGAKGEASLINSSFMKYYKDSDENSKLSRFLTYCDTHINSHGDTVNLSERLGDIFNRYDKSHIVHKNITKYTTIFEETEKYVEKYLKGE